MKNLYKVDTLIRIILFWSIALILISLFEEEICYFFCKYLDYTDFEDVSIKIVFTLIILLSSYLLIRSVKIFNYSLFLNSICVCLIYSLLRFNVIEHKSWDFMPVIWIIKYTDAFFILLIISLKPCITKFAKKLKDKYISKSGKTTQLNEISSNSAIETKEEDLFHYATDAENFLKILVNNKNRTERGAIVVGLIGAWGKGKTSYLNLMRNYAETRQDVILIRINVWKGQNYEDMAKNFLSAIANGIDDISLKNIINNYSKTIIDADISFLSKLFRLFSIGKPKQSEELFNIVGQKIIELDKCLIVQVDDIDRLTKEETFYTLKFIRNVANFYNTFFIVAYDETYLKKQFSELNIEESYLEKIFNVTYPLPTIRKEEYIKIVQTELENSLMFDADDKTVFDEFMNLIDGNLSLRNARRLVSSIRCGLSMLKDEDGKIMIDLLDYILVQYLQLMIPNAYDFLANFKKNVVDFKKDKSIIQRGNVYIINKETFSDGEYKELSDEEYLKHRLSRDIRLDIEKEKEELNLTYKIFRTLFNTDRLTVIGISYVNSFQVYFERVLDQKLITKNKFLNSFKSGITVFSKDLETWYKEYDKYTLSENIAIFRCLTVAEWLDFFKSILHITPKSCHEYKYQDKLNGKFIPTPGLGVIKEGSKENITVLQNAISLFFFDINTLASDSLEILQKKFVLLYNGIRNTSNYASSPYFNEEHSMRSIFELYWKLYSKQQYSYDDFNEDFWYYIDRFLNFQDKLDMREAAKKHIKENINSFIENYPINDISKCYSLYSLFKEYTFNGNTATGNDVWIPNYRDFLKSIESKSEAVTSYIDGFCKLYGA